ncbi:MAG: hypothetical protein KJ621_10650, partial [Proteobacteria bacterium]|nr:hypothetical protein [Pseudomonadota bacterium]
AAAWLADRMPRPESAPDRQTISAVYHRPCHLPADQAVKVERFLRVSPGLSLTVLPDQCCGHGGLFRLFHPRTSAAIGQDRLAAVETARPDLVLTNCSGCAWQLWEGLYGSRTRVRHPLEVVAGRVGEA